MTYEAALGYMIKAMKSLKYPSKEIKKIEKAMHETIDLMDEKSAEKIYQNF